MPFSRITPPLVNSANPWCTTLEHLQALFDCTSTGAVTTRTSLLNGFEHDAYVHQFTFFGTDDHASGSANLDGKNVPATFRGSLNTLGYSPIPLDTYLSMIRQAVAASTLPEEVRTKKPFIVSVTGSAEEVVECYRKIQDLQKLLSNQLCMEINLSCPNIPDKPPPAYSAAALTDYLRALASNSNDHGHVRVAIGIKTPPYTYQDQFQVLINALLATSSPTCPVDFITATNTLGSSLILSDMKGSSALNSASGAGIGGMAGAPLHPLALGNIRTIRTMLDHHDQLRSIKIIGVGGVDDGNGFERMLAVGADVVGVGTALGREGVIVFEKILSGQTAF